MLYTHGYYSNSTAHTYDYSALLYLLYVNVVSVQSEVFTEDSHTYHNIDLITEHVQSSCDSITLLLYIFTYSDDVTITSTPFHMENHKSLL